MDNQDRSLNLIVPHLTVPQQYFNPILSSLILPPPPPSCLYSGNHMSRAVTSGKRSFSVDSGSIFLGQGLGPGLGPGLGLGSAAAPVNNGFGLGGLVSGQPQFHCRSPIQGLGPYQGQGPGHCRSPVQGQKRNIMNIPIGRPQAKVIGKW